MNEERHKINVSSKIFSVECHFKDNFEQKCNFFLFLINVQGLDKAYREEKISEKTILYMYCN